MKYQRCLILLMKNRGHVKCYKDYYLSQIGWNILWRFILTLNLINME